MGDQSIKYEIVQYEVLYYLESEDLNEASVHIINNEEQSKESSGSDLFLEHETEGGDEQNDEYKNAEESKLKENILWKCTKLGRDERIQIQIDSMPKCRDIYSKPPRLKIRIRILFNDKCTNFTFWSVYSDDFIIDFGQIAIKNKKNRKITYGTPQFLPKHKETPKMDDKKDAFYKKYYNASVFDPNQNEQSEEKQNYSHHQKESDHSISPLFSSSIAILKEDEDEYKITNSRKKKQQKSKRKNKRRSNHSWSHSLNLKLTNLFTSNSNGTAMDDMIQTNGYSEREKNKKNEKI